MLSLSIVRIVTMMAPLLAWALRARRRHQVRKCTACGRLVRGGGRHARRYHRSPQ